MNLLIYTLLSFLAFNSAIAAQAAFEEWLGHWKGSCELNPADNAVKDFNAQLKIEALPNSKNFKWQLIYEANSQMAREERNYNLLTIDSNQGHYVVDENNGLLLDSYLKGSVLYSPFTINGKLISVTYSLQSKNEMIVDMPMFETKPIRKTCIKSNLNMCASSFALLSVQRCKFTK